MAAAAARCSHVARVTSGDAAGGERAPRPPRAGVDSGPRGSPRNGVAADHGGRRGRFGRTATDRRGHPAVASPPCGAGQVLEGRGRGGRGVQSPLPPPTPAPPPQPHATPLVGRAGRPHPLRGSNVRVTAGRTWHAPVPVPSLSECGGGRRPPCKVGGAGGGGGREGLLRGVPVGAKMNRSRLLPPTTRHGGRGEASGKQRRAPAVRLDSGGWACQRPSPDRTRMGGPHRVSLPAHAHTPQSVLARRRGCHAHRSVRCGGTGPRGIKYTHCSTFPTGRSVWSPRRRNPCCLEVHGPALA